ncbi:MAG: DUF1538 domain-containing protein [Clostridiales bacterium]|nr:DUF1538 domain-containing protein [Clostridiales bacterium]
MLKALLTKFKEATVSVLPVTVIVLLLNFTPLVNFTAKELWVFVGAAIALIIGMSLFNLGADIAMTPMGEQIGSGLSKSGKFKTLLLICFVMGLFITIAEPDLSVLAEQVASFIDPTLLKITIGVGVGLFLVLGIVKIVFRVSLSWMLTFFYMLLFALVSIVIVAGGGEQFLPLAFDSGGVTTGPITVPFIMALGVGVATTLGDKRQRENNFGFIALCSIGPILAVMMLGAVSKGEIDYEVSTYPMHAEFIEIVKSFLDTMLEVGIALAPIVLFFFILQAIFMQSSKKRLKQIIIGIFYTFFGLVIFLTSVHVGFMPIGYKMGTQLATNNPVVMVVMAFILGFAVVLAEPAIHVLNKQVETVTGGAISKRSMLIALSVGVGASIGLSVIRVIFDFSILYYLIPGYFLSLGLSFFVPKLYTAIAFDSGGVASGPLTSTFILPFIVGICFVLQPEKILLDAFGLVAMVAMTPLITIQVLGFRAVAARHIKEKIAMKRILSADDEQIIQFM